MNVMNIPTPKEAGFYSETERFEKLVTKILNNFKRKLFYVFPESQEVVLFEDVEKLFKGKGWVMTEKTDESKPNFRVKWSFKAQ